MGNPKFQLFLSTSQHTSSCTNLSVTHNKQVNKPLHKLLICIILLMWQLFGRYAKPRSTLNNTRSTLNNTRYTLNNTRSTFNNTDLYYITLDLH